MEWISVTDRVPEARAQRAQKYIVWCDGELDIAYHIEDDHFGNPGYEDSMKGLVTHWMTAPEPPCE